MMQKTPECFWGLLYIQTYDKVSVMKTEDLYKKIAQEIIMSTGAFEWAERKGMEFQKLMTYYQCARNKVPCSG